MNFVAASLVTGFVGDAVLQLISGEKWGLAPYFQQHGKVESLFIASGMMGIFSLLYVSAGLPLTVLPLFIYGVLLDFAFRFLKLAPSLGTYYQVQPVPVSAFWGGAPFIMAWGVWKFLIPQ